jgi:hypothetical protein
VLYEQEPPVQPGAFFVQGRVAANQDAVAAEAPPARLAASGAPGGQALPASAGTGRRSSIDLPLRADGLDERAGGNGHDAFDLASPYDVPAFLRRQI